MNDGDDIVYVDYTDESMLADIQALVSKDLSEPYSIFTYRYFLHNWPKLCICAYTCSASGEPDEMIGTIICKAETEGENFLKGYIAMLAVSTSQRKKGIGLKVFLRLEYTPRCMLYHFLSCHTIFTSIFCRFPIHFSFYGQMARMGIDRMISMGCEEVGLEAEATNSGALSTYHNDSITR